MDIPPSPGKASSLTFAARGENLNSTLKWLVASAGAIAAAIVAGLQLTAIANLQPWAALIAACGATVALIAIGVILLGATRVLALQGKTVNELSNDELDAGVLDPKPNLDAAKLPPQIAWVHERRTFLLGDATSITSLYADGIVGAKRALDALRRGEPSTWSQRDLDPAVDVAWLEREYAATTARVELLEEAATYWQKRDAYSQLLDKAPRWFALFVLGVVIFAIMPVWGRANPAAEITDPLPVQIYVKDARVAGVPDGCPATLSGRMVGGSLQQPIVVTLPIESCPALKLKAQDSDALIIVPNPADSSGSSR
ncbi:hypothetical protein SAMN04487917_11320 [Arthrobacter sp. yr096]|uniref:hypothetical protein n=1 Tax=Arthrobacter sp. yr096 TaxID=1761750 RepID=UPI0008BD9952|nr:hypothetical protein [Arthrobacter sp. yr096]SEJ77302.1 hypothetical protein SAMN04487917_11320 [Arthrobacter sp. yr096]